MNALTPASFALSGVAVPLSASGMLEEICDHFIEHAEVEQTAHGAILRSADGLAKIRIADGRLLIDLDCPTADHLRLIQTSLAEHLFYFAEGQPFSLEWSRSNTVTRPPNLHEVTVVSAMNVTPKMRRVTFSIADATPFARGDMHVQLLVPPKGRRPVWPGFREDGRLSWPQGEDELIARTYTIRGVDCAAQHFWIDFLLHGETGEVTPGADFARTAEPGTIAAIMGPGGGHVPEAERILMIGDETALPAIARIIEEVPEGTRITAIIEVESEAEQQSLEGRCKLDLHWLHRARNSAPSSSTLLHAAMAAIEGMEAGTFVWAATEKQTIRSIRSVLKARQYDRKLMYVAWYWERD